MLKNYDNYFCSQLNCEQQPNSMLVLNQFDVHMPGNSCKLVTNH